MVELRNFQGLDDAIVVDTSEGGTAYLLIGPDNRHIRLSPSAYQLLKSVSEGTSFAALADQLSQIQQRAVQPEEVEKAYQHIMARLTTIGQQLHGTLPGFWLRVPLIPAWLVERIARPLSIVFQWMALPILLGSIALIGILLSRFSFTPPIDSSDFWLAYGLFLISLVAHEFGHASACARYGAQPHTIGFAIYWIYPVFYSDVSTAWQLSRWQRVVVDLGGIFFQSVVGAGFGIIYMVYGWEPAYVALLMIVYSCVFSLNPILRFDGYWVLADALGVTNLGKQPRRVLAHVLARLRNRPTAPLPWPPYITITMSVYTVVSFAFWAYFIWYLLPFVWNVWSTYPIMLATMITTVWSTPYNLTSSMLETFFASTFTALIAVLMTFRLLQAALRPLTDGVGRYLRSRDVR